MADPAPRVLTAALWADFRREGSVALPVRTSPPNRPDGADRGQIGFRKVLWVRLPPFSEHVRNKS